MIIAPLIKDNNLVDTYFGKAFYFDFKYHSKSKIWIIVLSIVLPLLAIIIVGLIIYFKKRKKDSNQDSNENNTLSQELKNF